MKTKKLSIAIALLAVAVIGTSCGNKQQKSSSDTTTEQTTSSALEIDSLLANAEKPCRKRSNHRRRLHTYLQAWRQENLPDGQ